MGFDQCRWYWPLFGARFSTLARQWRGKYSGRPRRRFFLPLRHWTALAVFSGDQCGDALSDYSAFSRTKVISGALDPDGTALDYGGSDRSQSSCASDLT